MKQTGSNQQKEVRINQKSYCDRWAEHLWNGFKTEVMGACDLRSYIRRKLWALQPMEKEVDEIMMRLRQKCRDEARPADAPSRPSKNRMYK